MQVPLQISFHGMDPSDWIEQRVREKVAKLEKYYRQIISCRVAIEAAHKQPHKSSLQVMVTVHLRGHELVAKRERRHHASRDDAYQAINETFDVMMRQLEEQVRVQRHDVKVHEGAQQYGRVVRLERDSGHGFIETPEGLNLFFARDVVADDGFDRLAVDSEVLYVAAEGEGPMGPQASLVRLVGSDHHIR
jgi:ribosomal subunit interface protein